MKLYHAPQTRSVRPRWLLEEMGVPYELVKLDMSKGEHKTPAYLKIHPHGALPALLDGDLAMIESGAICSYLADKFPDKQMAPPLGTPARGRYEQWMFYTMATLEPPIVQLFMHTIMLPEAQRSAQVVEESRTAYAACARVLSDALAGRTYLLGEQFTAADVMVGSTLAWAQMMGLTNDWPELAAYVQRLATRPAFQHAQA
jgi:glutathione S-transferase